MRPTRMSGVGLALVISLAIDQIFCFAPSMRPDMEPVVSSTKQTSIFGLSFFSGGSSFARALAATSNVHVSSVATVYVPLTLALSRGERGQQTVPARNVDVSSPVVGFLSPKPHNRRQTEDGGVVRAR